MPHQAVQALPYTVYNAIHAEWTTVVAYVNQ